MILYVCMYIVIPSFIYDCSISSYPSSDLSICSCPKKKLMGKLKRLFLLLEMSESMKKCGSKWDT